MKKDLATHFSFAIALFALITLFNRWFSLDYIPFWVGGIIGTLLPDVDHLIYAYVLKPHEVTSQRVASLISQRQVGKTWDLISATRTERKDLIFHSATFQLLFVVFAFLVITSSGSILGSGIVLAFLLHLLIDQVMDLVETGSVNVWFERFPFQLDSEQKRYYLVANGLIILVLSIYL